MELVCSVSCGIYMFLTGHKNKGGDLPCHKIMLPELWINVQCIHIGLKSTYFSRCTVFRLGTGFTVFFSKEQMTFCFIFIFNVYQMVKCLLWKWINCSCCLFAQHHSYSCQYWSCRHSSSRTGHHGHCAYISGFAYRWYHSYHCSGLVLVSISMAELRT